MKVLLHTNHGLDRMHLLVFNQKNMTKKQLRQIIATGGDQAAQMLFMRASQNVEIPVKERRRAELVADFVVGSAGYTAERLA